MYEIMPVYEKATAAALAKWRGWAQEIAAGGNTPSMSELIEVAALLDIQHAARELEHDASALMEVKQLEEQAEAVRLAARERLTCEGGMEGVKEKLAAARREVARLEKLTGISPMQFRAADLDQRANTIRRSRPRVFAPQEKRTKMAATSTTKKTSKATKKKAVPA